jgi:hypothetical protein
MVVLGVTYSRGKNRVRYFGALIIPFLILVVPGVTRKNVAVTKIQEKRDY